MQTILHHIVLVERRIFVNYLENLSTILLEWLNNNYMKVNTGESHLVLSGNSRAAATIGNSYIESEDEKY